MNTAKAVIDVVCERRKVSLKEILVHNRYRPYAHARQEAQYVLRVISGKSLPEIGRVFNRDHTTIIYSLSAVESRMRSDAYRGEMEEMIREVRKKTGAFTSRRLEQQPVFKSVRKSLPAE